LASGASALEVSKAVLGGPRSPQPPSACDLLLDGLALLTSDGPAIAVPVLKRAVTAFREHNSATEEAMRWFWLAGRVAAFVWDYEGWDMLTGRQIQVARDEGALAMLPLALIARAEVHIFAGELVAATSLYAESDALSEATGRAGSGGALPLDAFGRGQDEATRQIEAATSELIARGEGVGLTQAQWASALLYNGLGRYEDALAAAEQAAEDPHELWFSTWVAVELIEAASRTGKAERALGALEWLPATARAGGNDWGLGVEARSRALLSHGDAAESLYREAIERLQRTRLRPHLARAHLLYGEWLRRERRRTDAREQLRTASELFTAMGIKTFAARAQRELLATGDHVANAASRPGMSSPLRRLRSRGSPATASPTETSPIACSSASTPWLITYAKCSPSSTSPRATNSHGRCPRARVQLRLRSRRPAWPASRLMAAR
jgi:tetratricopeptide (TPR) repeat protein